MIHKLWLVFLVGIGGAAGSIARYCVSILAQRFMVQWPAGTFAVNILGCFVIGCISAYAERGGVSPECRLTLATGFCGGFTTMSSMIYETAGMMRTGEYGSSIMYGAGTLLVAIPAFFMGHILIRCFFK